MGLDDLMRESAADRGAGALDGPPSIKLGLDGLTQ